MTGGVWELHKNLHAGYVCLMCILLYFTHVVFFQLYFRILWQQIKRKVVVYKKGKYTDNSLMLQMEKMAHFIKKGKAQFIMK